LNEGIAPSKGFTGQHNTEKRGHTLMPGAGFEPMIGVFERSNIIQRLSAATGGRSAFL